MKFNALSAFTFSLLLMTACVPNKFNTEPEVKGLEGAAPVQTLTNPDARTDVTMRVGGTLIIKLDANATTGYFWQVGGELDTTILEEVSSEYTTDDHPPGMVGGGGTRVFEFKAVDTGQTILPLGYSRFGQPFDDVRKIMVDVIE